MMMFKQYINLFKLRIGVVITLAALGGMAITPGQALTSWQVIILSLTVMVASAAAGAFNQYFERDIDAKMTRTQNRPFVNGFFQHSRKWLVIIGLMLALAVISAALAFNAMTALNIFLGAFTYAIVYTAWLKRRTWLNIVFGGLARRQLILHLARFPACWHWYCFCGRPRISGAWQSSFAINMRRRGSTCCRW